MAYAALTDTMDGAIEMGRIAMGVVRNKPRKAAFMALMQDALLSVPRDLGAQPTGEFTIEAAPEHERGGRA